MNYQILFQGKLRKILFFFLFFSPKIRCDIPCELCTKKYFSYFPKKTGSDISCKLTPKETILYKKSNPIFCEK